MTLKFLPRHPMLVLDDSKKEKISLGTPSFCEISSSDGIDPYAGNAIWPGPVTFGGNGRWNPEKNDITIQVELEFSPTGLFGEHGIACTGATLGAALEWQSVESRQRDHAQGTVEFRNNDKSVKCRFTLFFLPNQMRGRILLTVRLYIIKGDPDPKRNEKHLANQPGMFLGNLSDICTLAFDGTGSMFPVRFRENDAATDPLWRIVFNSSSPETDPFAIDYICLELNRRHPDCTILTSEERQDEMKKIMRQIMAAWWTHFFIILKEDYNSLYLQLQSRGNEQYEEGSIAHIASYIITTHLNNVKLTNPSELSEGLQRYVNKIRIFGIS